MPLWGIAAVAELNPKSDESRSIEFWRNYSVFFVHETPNILYADIQTSNLENEGAKKEINPIGHGEKEAAAKEQVFDWGPPGDRTRDLSQAIALGWSPKRESYH